MIVLCTDFGLAGPYTGQVKAVLHALAPAAVIVDLFADMPAANPKASAYLLAAYDEHFPAGSVFLCIVDPGVGSARRGLCVKAGPHWYVGPDNGLFEIVMRQAGTAVEAYEIAWRPARLSASFHGRDLFAPIAARLAGGESPPASTSDFLRLGRDAIPARDWPDDLPEIVYLDHYGNAMTGIRAATLGDGAGLVVDGRRIPRAETFSSVSPGEVFCYENSNGLMEIAICQGSAYVDLKLRVGTSVKPTKR